MLERPAIRLAVVVVVVFGFGLGFGLNYGSSNQCVYLLESVRAFEPNLWSRDWLVTQTQAYHPAYAWFCTWLLSLSREGVAVAVANVIFAASGMAALYVVTRKLLTEPRASLTFLVVVLLASATRTQAPGLSYAFSEIFQPSSVASAGLLAAGAALVANSPVASGLLLALGGVFHVNYLVLGVCVFGAAWLLQARQRWLHHVLFGIGPALLLMLWFLPFLLANSDATRSVLAQEIYQHIRSPHHYLVSSFAWDFAAWVGFQCLGAAALLGPACKGPGPARNLLCLLAGFWLLIVPATLLSSVVVLPFVNQLFAWRVAAHAELFAQAGLAALLVRVLADGAAAASEIVRSRWSWGLGGFGLCSLLMGARITGKWDAAFVVLGLLVAAGLVFAARALRGDFAWLGKSGVGPGPLAFGLLVALVAVNVTRFARLARDSNLISGAEPGLVELCGWVGQHTKTDSLFLIPPEQGEFRFRCRRSIVIDWKSPPGRPAEVVEWFARIQAVAGDRPVRGPGDLVGYQSLDLAHVTALRERYGFDYWVVERAKARPVELVPVFSGTRYVVYRLPSRAPELTRARGSERATHG